MDDVVGRVFELQFSDGAVCRCVVVVVVVVDRVEFRNNQFC